MDLTALKAEITADPVSLGYAAFLPDSPGHVADLLNALTQTMIQDVSAAVGLTWAAAGPYADIVDAANNTASPVRASCLAVRDGLLAGQSMVLSNPQMAAMFTDWITAGVITQAQHDALIVLATKPASRAQVLGFGTVAEADLRSAGVI